MISSNGGSWSNTDLTANNVVKSFKFAKGDIVICDYDPNACTLNFSKEKSKETYSHKFQHVDGDPFHPCCLFYYASDEVEFINNYKPPQEW